MVQIMTMKELCEVIDYDYSHISRLNEALVRQMAIPPLKSAVFQDFSSCLTFFIILHNGLCLAWPKEHTVTLNFLKIRSGKN